MLIPLHQSVRRAALIDGPFIIVVGGYRQANGPDRGGVRNRPCIRQASKARTRLKTFEENNEAGRLDKADEIVGVVLPANEDPAIESRRRSPRRASVAC